MGILLSRRKTVKVDGRDNGIRPHHRLSLGRQDLPSRARLEMLKFGVKAGVFFDLELLAISLRLFLGSLHHELDVVCQVDSFETVPLWAPLALPQDTGPQ